jgi:hypothetical protein
MKERHIRGRARRPPEACPSPPRSPLNSPPPYLSLGAFWFLLGILGIVFVFGTTLPLLSPWFSKSYFLGIIQILFLTINVCITPTIAAWISKGKSRIMQSSLA